MGEVTSRQGRVERHEDGVALEFVREVADPIAGRLGGLHRPAPAGALDRHLDRREPYWQVPEVPRWRVEVALREGAGVTTVTFTHRMSPADAVGDIGPGWLYYLDRVEASRTDAPMPE